MPAAGPDLNWPIASIAQPLLRTRLSDLTFQGMIGALFRSATVSAIYADLGALTIPGLRDAGIEASISALSGDGDHQAALLRRGRAIVYGFAEEPFEEVEDEDSREEGQLETQADSVTPKLVEIDRACMLTEAGLISGWTDSHVTWQDDRGRSHSEPTAAFCARFIRMLELSPGGTPATRRVALTAAVRRATVFALAYPDRFLTDSDADAGLRARAGDFLFEAAGRQQDTLSRRWRASGAFFQACRASAALNQLYDATLRTLNLPDSLYHALASPHDERLTDLQLRELIYLARAGTRDLKVLAAYRLSSERSASGVSSTLHQLETSPDPLVRAAATLSPI